MSMTKSLSDEYDELPDSSANTHQHVADDIMCMCMYIDIHLKLTVIIHVTVQCTVHNILRIR